MSRQRSLILLIALAIAPRMMADGPEKELGNKTTARYKGMRLSVMVAGFYAGEFKRSMTAREYFVNWRHYDESLAVKREKNVLDQIDERTFATRPPLIGNDLGSNIIPVEKGEELLVSNAFFYCGRGLCSLTLYLDTMKLSKTAGLDPRKQTRTSLPMFESAGLGCAFTFAFAPEALQRPGAEQLIVATVNKYFQPTDQAEKLLKAAKNIEIEIGATEEDVVAKLGEPLRTIRVGSQKTLKYPDMTIILKDGKVSEVKVE
jgi:hypothetical protein